MYCGREADLERDIGSILDAGSAGVVSAGVVVMADTKGMLDARYWMLGYAVQARNDRCRVN
jgi:hypothetical protein